MHLLGSSSSFGSQCDNTWSKFTNIESDVDLSICNFDRALVLNVEWFSHMCEEENRSVKEGWEGWEPTEHKCDLAQGLNIDVGIV